MNEMYSVLLIYIDLPNSMWFFRIQNISKTEVEKLGIDNKYVDYGGNIVQSLGPDLHALISRGLGQRVCVIQFKQSPASKVIELRSLYSKVWLQQTWLFKEFMFTAKISLIPPVVKLYLHLSNRAKSVYKESTLLSLLLCCDHLLMHCYVYCNLFQKT